MQIIHEKNRPTVRDYLPMVFENFIELHGDRFYGDDAAILGGIGTLDGQPVTVLAQVKGRDLKENQQTNFSMPHPEGYRKALRLAKQAEKFHRPVVCLARRSADRERQSPAISWSLCSLKPRSFRSFWERAAAAARLRWVSVTSWR